MKKAALLVVGTMLAVACSSGGSGTSTPLGTNGDGGAAGGSDAATTTSEDGGNSTKDAAADSTSAPPTFSVASQYLVAGTGHYTIDLNSYADGCAVTLDGNSHKQNSSKWAIEISALNLSNPVVPGTYPVNPNATDYQVLVGYKHWDSTCKKTESWAQSGTLTLTKVSDTLVEGSFTAPIGDFGEVTQAFSAPKCDLSGQTGSQKCLP